MRRILVIGLLLVVGYFAFNFASSQPVVKNFISSQKEGLSLPDVSGIMSTITDNKSEEPAEAVPTYTPASQRNVRSAVTQPESVPQVEQPMQAQPQNAPVEAQGGQGQAGCVEGTVWDSPNIQDQCIYDGVVKRCVYFILYGQVWKSLTGGRWVPICPCQPFGQEQQVQPYGDPPGQPGQQGAEEDITI